MFQRFLLLLFVILLFIPSFAQTDDLEKKVDEAFLDSRSQRFEKLSALRSLGSKVFPYLEKYISDSNDDVRGSVLRLVRKQTSDQALNILLRLLTGPEDYVRYDSIIAIHNEYVCSDIRSAKNPKIALLGYFEKNQQQTKVVQLLSCFSDDPEIRRLFDGRRKDKGPNQDGGIHHGLSFNLSIEMALSEAGDATAVDKVRNYIREADVKNLLFILDNIKFVSNKDIRKDLVELLNDKRPVYNPVSIGNFYLRVCDLAMTALTSTDPTIITGNIEKSSGYPDAVIKAAYTKLKAEHKQNNEKQEESPIVISAIAPQYPVIATATRIEGEVVVEIKIAQDGSVLSTKTISGHKRLVDASEKAAKHWKFSPLTEGQKEKVVELHFVYSSDYNKNQKISEFSVIFTPPFKVEIIFIPGITHSSQKNR